MAIPNIDTSRGPKELYADILDYVEKANAMVAAREPLLLAGLDDCVAALCERIMALTPEEARTYMPDLEALMARIDDLQKNMQKLQSDVATALKTVGKQRKATIAYTNAPTGMTEEE